MMHSHEFSAVRSMSGLDRTPIDQVSENLTQALRVLELVPAGQSELVPHPIVTARAEIRNAQRYLMALSAVKHQGELRG